MIAHKYIKCWIYGHVYNLFTLDKFQTGLSLMSDENISVNSKVSYHTGVYIMYFKQYGEKITIYR